METNRSERKFNFSLIENNYLVMGDYLTFRWQRKKKRTKTKRLVLVSHLLLMSKIAIKVIMWQECPEREYLLPSFSELIIDICPLWFLFFIGSLQGSPQVNTSRRYLIWWVHSSAFSVQNNHRLIVFSILA